MRWRYMFGLPESQPKPKSHILYMMQGIPGSGKSTVARAIKRLDVMTKIYSTDEFWIRDGTYQFDGSRLREAHEWNQRRAGSHMEKSYRDNLIIDNTNIKQKDAQVYFDLARRYDYTVQVVRVDPGLGECLRRNAQRTPDRKIPEEVIVRMHGAMEDLWK
jgi:predicted kinase